MGAVKRYKRQRATAGRRHAQPFWGHRGDLWAVCTNDAPVNRQHRRARAHDLEAYRGAELKSETPPFSGASHPVFHGVTGAYAPAPEGAPLPPPPSKADRPVVARKQMAEFLDLFKAPLLAGAQLQRHGS